MMHRRLNHRGLYAIAALCLGFGMYAYAEAPPNVDLDVNPGISTPGGVDFDGNGVNAFYQYTVYDGQEVNDTIPVEICMTGESRDGWTSIAVTFGAPAGSLPGVTAPPDQTFTRGASVPDCRHLSITIASGVLALSDPSIAENFTANFSLSGINPRPSTGNDKPGASFVDIKNIHIQVTVLPLLGSNLSCFLTDSEGNYLNDCSGAPVTESGSGRGRFAIVANKRGTAVATNPGQFYYNLVWLNTTGSLQTVDVEFARIGVVTKGMQAIHAAVFNGYLAPLTPEAFNQANEDGIPEGSDDAVVGIEVPAGASLLVTYHLEWQGLGASVPADCAGNCEAADQRISVTGGVSGEGIVEEDCTAEAYGYKKR